MSRKEKNIYYALIEIGIFFCYTTKETAKAQDAGQKSMENALFCIFVRHYGGVIRSWEEGK